MTGEASARAGERPTVLLVEDDPDLQRLLAFNLESWGYRAIATGAGELAVRAAIDHAPALVLLDVMLPDISGVEVCRRIRALEDLRQPAIVMLTARGSEMDRVAAFEIGADDYVLKPFSVRELRLRIAARLRTRDVPARAPLSTRASPPRRRFVAGPLEVDPEGHHVCVNGAEVQLTLVEMGILVYLFEGRGLVHSRQQMLAKVLRYAPDVATRTIDMHIKRLRDKLGPAGWLVQTVRGLGYRLSDLDSPPG